MTDRILVTIAAIGLGLALLLGMQAHVRHDDRVRAERAECLRHDEVDDLCWRAVREHVDRMERMACSCWEVPR